MDPNNRPHQENGDSNHVNNQYPAGWTPNYAYPNYPFSAEGLPQVPQNGQMLPTPAYGYYATAGYPPPQPQQVFYEITQPEAVNDDDLNQAEIDAELSCARIVSDDEYEEANDEELEVMEEFEKEIENAASIPVPAAAAPTQAAVSTSRSGKFLPVGATPGQNGILNEHAAEFWFPECRHCTCCSGFKHGCQCCKNGVNTCTDPNCVNQEYATEVASTLASRQPAPTPGPAHAPAPMNNRQTSHSGSRPSNAPFASNGVHAAEFWFPESRNCTCCKGYKHGCVCCKERGNASCGDPNCVNQEFASEVASTLSSRQSASASAPNSSFSGPPSSASANASSAPTAVCRYFAQGACRFGASCRNLHPAGSGESRTTVGQGALCSYDTRCVSRGTSCQYRHTPCRFLVSIQPCRFGDSCMYSHVPSDLGQGAMPNFY